VNITKEQLRESYAGCSEAGQLTDRFARLAMEIARGYLQRRAPSLQPCEAGEIVSNFSLRLVGRWRKVDPAKNIFSYLTQMTNYAALDYFRKRERETGRHIEMDGLTLAQADALLEDRIQRIDAEMRVEKCGDCDVVVSALDGQTAILFEGE